MITRTQRVLMLLEAVHPLTHTDVRVATRMNTGLTSRVLARLMQLDCIRPVNVNGRRHYEPMGVPR